MQFTIKKEDIVGRLNNIRPLTTGSMLPITQSVLIKATIPGVIELSATDLETYYTGSFPAEVETEGEIAINAQLLYEIFKQFPQDSIIIREKENRWIELSNDNITYNIVGMDPEEFPQVGHDNKEPMYIECDTQEFKKAIKQVTIIKDSDSYFGVLLCESAKQEGLCFISTDGSRLVTARLKHYPVEAHPKLTDKLHISKRGISIIDKFLDKQSLVQIGFQDNNFVFKQGTDTIQIRLLASDFPAYEDILTQQGVKTISLDRQLFLNMLKRMYVLYSDDYRGGLFNLQTSKLTITIENPGVGEAKEEMDIVYEGDELNIGFNIRFFIDTFNVIDDDTVNLSLTDEKSPCFIWEADSKQFLSVIMPIKI